MHPSRIHHAFDMEGGSYRNGLPAIDAPVFFTGAAGTLYLKTPAVAVLGHTVVNPLALQGFLSGFNAESQFSDYLNDERQWTVGEMVRKGDGMQFQTDPDCGPRRLPDSAHLAKIAGQLCYMSFGPDRTRNRDTVPYMHNITSSGHGSVVEHASVTLICYGISRSLTHELVRHRAGMAYSQVSQRYVDESRLRFVERPEYQDDPELHRLFEEEIDRQAALYEDVAQKLLQRQEAGAEILSGEKKRDRRKKVNQAARSVLGNHAEAPIIATGNLRAWRHVVNMRASEHAEVEIRRAMYRAFLCLAMLDPIVFGDFRIVDYADGTKGVTTPYPKV